MSESIPPFNRRVLLLALGLLLFCITPHVSASQDLSRLKNAERYGVCKSRTSEICRSQENYLDENAFAATRERIPSSSAREYARTEARLGERFSKRIQQSAARQSTARQSTARQSTARQFHVKPASFNGAVNVQDSLALVALYNALDGPSWDNNTRWLVEPVATWHGISVNDAGRVVALELPGNNLFGELPTELMDLSELVVLDLFDNFIVGPIPVQIDLLTNLVILDFGFNFLEEEIPASIGNLSNLVELVLWGNFFSGQIPVSFSNLDRLIVLSLEFNDLTGSIPPELGQLTSLEEFFVDVNLLSGQIPPELGNLNNLRSLFLGDNNFVGSLPAEVVSLSSLEVLSIPAAGLTGEIPSEIGSLNNLVSLDLGLNQLEGSIPIELRNLFQLGTLLLDENQLSGEIPVNIGFDLPNLVSLNLAGNQLTGSIPPSIGTMGVLNFLDLSRNLLSGEVPDFEAAQRLSFLYLDRNGLSGSISSQFSSSLSLIDVNLSVNNLTGPIPGAFANSVLLEALRLAANSFDGEIPVRLTTLQNLQVLDLWNNNLDGEIPNQIANQLELVTIDFGWNNLSGALPEGLDRPIALKNLFIDQNQLSGPVPESLAGADSLSVFVLNDNLFTHVPDLSGLSVLDSVSIVFNRLSFDSIEPNLGIAEGRFTYAPQRALPVVVDELENTIVFSVEAAGSANEYQWFLGNTRLNGGILPSYEATYATLSTPQQLILEVSSSVVTDLILESEPIRADARLATVVINPDSPIVAPGDSVQFEYIGIDQFGTNRLFSGTWETDAGVIDQAGVFVAGNVSGRFTVSVLDALGNEVGSTEVEVAEPVNTEEPLGQVLNYALHPSYPNPFSTNAFILVELPESAHTSLKVYDVLGREVEDVMAGMLPPGQHRIKVSGSSWPAGIYMYVLKANNFKQSGLMVKSH